MLSRKHPVAPVTAQEEWLFLAEGCAYAAERKWYRDAIHHLPRIRPEKVFFVFSKTVHYIQEANDHEP